MKRITKKWDTQKMRPVVVLDYDDVLFDFLGKVVNEYNKRMKTELKIEQITSWDLSEIGDIHVFMDIIRDARIWENMEEKGNSMRVVQRLINDGRWTVLICTACTTLEEYATKVKVIEEKLPGFDTSKIISCTDKHLIRGDVLIDDKIENCDNCNPFMNCILFDMPHNQSCQKYPRIKNLKQLPKMLEDMFCY